VKGLIEQVEDAAVVVESGLGNDHDLIRMYDAIDTLNARVRELKANVSKAAIAYLGDREIVNGDIRYYVGRKTTKKVAEPEQVGRALLERGGPDELFRFMSAGAFKASSLIAEHGETMPAEWFKIETKEELVVKRARVFAGGKDGEDVESE
jgi:hypothetical protein